ncbi:MAG: XTP/dITP diphosphatase [Deltaproteobacteria bacterium]|nr:XTP/dITP diphosphatase [Deltaproteobacteria bacterium]
MKIVLATENRHKVEEIRHFLGGLDLEMASLKNFPSVVLKEDGNTLRDNALQKARIVAKAAGQWALADDTGLFVEALDGKPGVSSARYAGKECDSQKNIDKLLAEMKNIPAEKRSAHFSCQLALVHPDGREVVVQGKLEGSIALKPGGEKGFGYDPIFYLPECHCTLAEISLEEKNKISHRGRALKGMRGVLESLTIRGVAQPG